MPASEIYLWLAYDKLSPIGDERSDIHAAQVSSSIFQSQGVKVGLDETLIKWKQTEKDQIQEGHNFFRSIQEAQSNGR